MFLWSGIFQSKWILSQLNTCIRKKKKPLLWLPWGLGESCQTLFWKKPHSKVVLSLKNKVERGDNLGEQMKGGRVSCGFTQHCPLLGEKLEHHEEKWLGNLWASLWERVGDCASNVRKGNKNTDIKRKEMPLGGSSLPSFPFHQEWARLGNPWLLPSLWHHGADFPHQSGAKCYAWCLINWGSGISPSLSKEDEHQIWFVVLSSPKEQGK